MLVEESSAKLQSIHKIPARFSNFRCFYCISVEGLGRETLYVDPLLFHTCFSCFKLSRLNRSYFLRDLRIKHLRAIPLRNLENYTLSLLFFVLSEIYFLFIVNQTSQDQYSYRHQNTKRYFFTMQRIHL